jgi:hypothetical protein
MHVISTKLSSFVFDTLLYILCRDRSLLIDMYFIDNHQSQQEALDSRDQ